MPVERREQAIAIWIGSTGNGRNPILNGRRQPPCGGVSRMNREVHVRFCEGRGVKFPGPTRPFAAYPFRTSAHHCPLCHRKRPDSAGGGTSHLYYICSSITHHVWIRSPNYSNLSITLVQKFHHTSRVNRGAHDVQRTFCKRPLLVRRGELHHQCETHPNGPMSLQGLPASIRNGSYVAGFL